MSQIKINEMVLHKSRLAGRMIYHAQINAGGKPNLVTISRHVGVAGARALRVAEARSRRARPRNRNRSRAAQGPGRVILTFRTYGDMLCFFGRVALFLSRR